MIDLSKSLLEDEGKNAKAYWTEYVNKFKARYKNYSSKELDEILAKRNMVGEELKVLRQLRSERNQAATDNQTTE